LIIKQIDLAKNSKADIDSIHEKANKEYADNLFQKLENLNHQIVSNTNANFFQHINTRFAELSKQMDYLSDHLSRKCNRIDTNITYLQNEIEKLRPKRKNQEKTENPIFKDLESPRGKIQSSHIRIRNGPKRVNSEQNSLKSLSSLFPNAHLSVRNYGANPDSSVH
jgi:phosphotransferase system IIB component